MGPRLLRQCHELPSQLFRLQEPARCGQAVQTLPEHRAQARVVLRWVAGGEHQHHITRVGILTLELPAAQGIRQRGAGHAKGRSVQRQLQRFPTRAIQHQRHRAARRLRRRVQLPAQSRKPRTAPLQPGGIAFRQLPVAGIQRLQDQVGRAGGAEQCQCTAHCSFLLYRGLAAQVQICAAGDHRQGLVGRIAAHGSPQCNGVQRLSGQKAQVGSMGVVHQQRHPKGVAHSRQGPDVLHSAQIIRAGDVDPKGGTPLPGQLLQRCCQHLCGDGAAAQRPGILCRRPEPPDIKIQQGSGVEQSLVGVPGCQQHRAAGPPGCPLQCQAQHGPDALGGALGAVIGVGRAEELGGVGLALGDDALRLVQLIGPLDLGQVQRLKAQQAPALVAGHVEPGDAGPGIPPHKIHNGGIHGYSQASPSAQALQVEPSSMGTSMPWAASSWFSATLIMMAHSMRFLNSSQPYSYTPVMLPVA